MFKTISIFLTAGIMASCGSIGSESESLHAGPPNELSKADGTSLCAWLGQPEECDVCALAGLYSNGQCDPSCALPDPDCQSPDGEQACGGPSSWTCQPAEYCEYGRMGCGALSEMGLCKPKPDLCNDFFASDYFAPVCGCDGRDYGSACLANRAGTSVAADGPCSPNL